MADEGMSDKELEGAKSVGIASGLGCSVVVALIGCIGLGILLDQYVDKAPLFTLIGVAIGLIAAGYQLYELTLVGRKDRGNGPVGRTIARGISARNARRRH